MTQDPSSIAKSLTVVMMECLGGPIAYRRYGVIMVRSGSTGTLRGLERRGLLDGATFTSLGLSVRAHLLSQGNGEGL